MTSDEWLKRHCTHRCVRSGARINPQICESRRAMGGKTQSNLCSPGSEGFFIAELEESLKHCLTCQGPTIL